MTDYRRFAVYYAPPEGSDLARFGAAWLGWDAQLGAEMAHPDLGLDAPRLTETPRKYGFHGTLKPPFRLAEGADRAGLSAAVSELAARHAPFDVPIKLARLGRFCALIPAEASDALATLAADCVRSLDHFRAPLNEVELAKRQASKLTGAQEAYLAQWGYPYILDEFRFHLTLTGRLDEAEAEAEPVEAALARVTAPLTVSPMPVREICLFGEAEDGRFRILERHALIA